MLERKTLENVVKVSKLFDNKDNGVYFFADTGDSLDNKVFNTISICMEGVFLVHDEWGECQTLVEIEKVKSIYEAIDTRKKIMGKKLFNLSW
jgi:hypothetical protein